MTDSETRVSDWSPLEPDEDKTYGETFAELRSRCPVAWGDDFGGFWALLKHEDIATACKKPKIFSSAPQFSVPHLNLGFPWLPLQTDGPQHQNYKSPLVPFLTKPKVTELVPGLTELAVNLIEHRAPSKRRSNGRNCTCRPGPGHFLRAEAGMCGRRSIPPGETQMGVHTTVGRLTLLCHGRSRVKAAPADARRLTYSQGLFRLPERDGVDAHESRVTFDRSKAFSANALELSVMNAQA
jgi:hypothetical protein